MARREPGGGKDGVDDLWAYAVSDAENSVGWAAKAAATRLAHDTGLLRLHVPALMGVRRLLRQC
ncbi:hypothetical protein LCGC14_2132060 [marine sediment metagenome]|uniref:Uncharacterized protein n=1 Tax=marine sediment metagenome TaxID=412755 RepID=A0A0F9GX41_9ZZZZ